MKSVKILDGAMKDRQNQIIYSTSPRSGFIIVKTFSIYNLPVYYFWSIITFNPITFSGRQNQVPGAYHFEDPDPTEDSFLTYFFLSLSLILTWLAATARDRAKLANVPSRAWLNAGPWTHLCELLAKIKIGIRKY